MTTFQDFKKMDIIILKQYILLNEFKDEKVEPNIKNLVKDYLWSPNVANSEFDREDLNIFSGL